MGGEKWEGKIEGILNIAPIWLGVDFGGDQVFSPWVHHFRVFCFLTKLEEKEGIDGSLPVCLSHSSTVGFIYLFIFKLITLGFFPLLI